VKRGLEAPKWKTAGNKGALRKSPTIRKKRGRTECQEYGGWGAKSATGGVLLSQTGGNKGPSGEKLQRLGKKDVPD